MAFVVVKPRREYPVVAIDMSDCTVSELVITSCIRGVQSCVMSPTYKRKAFLTEHTMENIRDTITS